VARHSSLSDADGRLISFLPFIIIAGCSKFNYVDKYTLADNIIIDGRGLDSFEIDKTRAKDVIKKLGRQFDEIRYKDYSVQMFYRDLGVSFYYMQGDNTKEIFSIVFSKPFKGKTSKGIILGQSTMDDVVKIYGEPDWTTCDNCDFWTSEYKGIQFSVEREKSTPQYPLDEELHLKRTIVEIEVTNE
jgi:hypothetical protein